MSVESEKIRKLQEIVLNHSPIKKRTLLDLGFSKDTVEATLRKMQCVSYLDYRRGYSLLDENPENYCLECHFNESGTAGCWRQMSRDSFPHNVNSGANEAKMALEFK